MPRDAPVTIATLLVFSVISIKLPPWSRLWDRRAAPELPSSLVDPARPAA
jgi:hypothetical protein